MNFFEAQEKAYKKTFMIFGLYILGMLAIVTVVCISIEMILYVSAGEPYSQTRVITIGFLVAATILLGTVMNSKSNGMHVAQSMGGKRIEPTTTEPNRKKLLNVVEEMALASGIPMPPVYILEDDSINAFAAGTEPDNVVIGVTKGCVEKLSRDELQGVIAHEFSHIFNGDMRINMRLIGIITGLSILFVGGRMILRVGSLSGRRNKGAGAIVVIGLLLLILGLVGSFFSKLIQAAISRQREFLADASAVQYTRNPDGISGALFKISRKSVGSEVSFVQADEYNHMFFASGLKSSLLGAFATHPPVQKRIKAIKPDFDFKVEERKVNRAQKEVQKEAPKKDEKDSVDNFFVKPEVILAAVGTFGSQDVSAAQNMLQEIPEIFRDAVHDSAEAEALVFSLLLSDDIKIRKKQREFIRHNSEAAVDSGVDKLDLYLPKLQHKWKLPLVELAMPVLKQLGMEQYQRFRKAISMLIAADNKISVFEFALESVVLFTLDEHFSEEETKNVEYKKISEVKQELEVLICAVSEYSDYDFAKCWSEVQKHLPNEAALKEPGTYVKQDFARIQSALKKLRMGSPQLREKILRSVLVAIMADKSINQNEKDYIHAIAAALKIPLPLAFHKHT